MIKEHNNRKCSRNGKSSYQQYINSILTQQGYRLQIFLHFSYPPLLLSSPSFFLLDIPLLNTYLLALYFPSLPHVPSISSSKLVMNDSPQNYITICLFPPENPLFFFPTYPSQDFSQKKFSASLSFLFSIIVSYS